MKSYLKFVNAIDLRELHAVVKQGLSDDVQDTQPLRARGKKEPSEILHCLHKSQSRGSL